MRSCPEKRAAVVVLFDVRCIRGHEEGQGDGDETTPIHAQFKAKVATEALRGDRTPGDRGQARSTSELVSGWKRQAQAGLEEVFAGATSRRQKDHEATIHDLHAKIGELTVEHDFLSPGLGR